MWYNLFIYSWMNRSIISHVVPICWDWDLKINYRQAKIYSIYQIPCASGYKIGLEFKYRSTQIVEYNQLLFWIITVDIYPGGSIISPDIHHPLPYDRYEIVVFVCLRETRVHHTTRGVGRCWWSFSSQVIYLHYLIPRNRRTGKQKNIPCEIIRELENGKHVLLSHNQNKTFGR